MCKIDKNSSKEAILNMIRKERPLVKEYVICCKDTDGANG